MFFFSFFVLIFVIFVLSLFLLIFFEVKCVVDRYKWQRPFQMAMTVYEREICVLVVLAVVLGNGEDVAVAKAVAVEGCGSLERKWDFFPSDIHVLYVTSNLVNK